MGIALVVGVVLLAQAAGGASSTRVASSASGVNPAIAVHCAVGSHPAFDAYDPVNHELYIPNDLSANLSIVKGCTVIATVTFANSSAAPLAAAFDPANNDVYVTDSNLNQVYVISGASVIATITSPSFNFPYGILFDPGDGVIAVANEFGNNVIFIDSYNIIVGSNSVGLDPRLLGYDPYYARLLVSNAGSNNVTSMDAIYPSYQSHNINIPVGTTPFGIAFNYANDEDYVANEGSKNVTVFYGTQTAGHSSVAVGVDPAGVVWDQAQLSIYVANQQTGSVSVISDLSVVRTYHGPHGLTSFLGIAYDDATGKVYVTNYSVPGSVYVYS
jgi:DNA-binding beta-propeller fold protein YncE